MHKLCLILAAALLAACGADGPPLRPDAAAASAPGPGVSVTGEASLGVVSG